MANSDDLPSTSELSALNDNVTSALKTYEAAQSQTEKSNALRALARSSQRLTNAATDTQDAFLNFTFHPLANACVRVALSINLFENLSDSEPRSSEELARLTKADPTLVYRVMRALAALDFVHDDGKSNYTHTALSKTYVKSSQKAYAVWMWDVMARTSGTIGPYFDENELENPTDAATAPFVAAWAEKGSSDVFAAVKETGKADLFNEAMAGSSTLCAKEAVTTYAFDELEPGDDGVVLVDVGGSKGQAIMEIRQACPNLRGKIILQELQSVLDGGVLEGLDAELQAYDFFKETQPVKGAGAYFYQRIFHDWSDKNCKQILKSLKPAMAPHSKLLICDVVVQDYRPPPIKILRDMNMLLVGGMERSEKQWKELLQSEGFTMVKVHGLDNENNSIVEARVES